MTYARDTEVPADKSRTEIEATLRRFGADQFLYGYDQEKAVIGFRFADRQVRFVVPLPTAKDAEKTEQGRNRAASARQPAREQMIRQRWRALALAVKAKLSVVEVGIATFEEEFMAHVILPNGLTVGDWMAPQIAEAYETGSMPNLLALGTGRATVAP